MEFKRVKRWEGPVRSETVHVVILVVAFLVSPDPLLAESSLAIQVEIHPALARERCSRLPAPTDVSDDPDFVSLLARGWVKLDSASYEAGDGGEARCLQMVSVSFPGAQEYYTFLESMSAAPQLPFWSGADHALQTAIFERVAREGDRAGYRILMSKDGRSTNETNPPLYGILRKNVPAFLMAFSELASAEKEIVVKTQYDFNLELEDQKIVAESPGDLSPKLQAVAEEFNELLRMVACTPTCPSER